jgi:hypothetical protein
MPQNPCLSRRKRVSISKIFSTLPRVTNRIAKTNLSHSAFSYGTKPSFGSKP